jgi:hypothetical protein
MARSEFTYRIGASVQDSRDYYGFELFSMDNSLNRAHRSCGLASGGGLWSTVDHGQRHGQSSLE